MSTWITKRAAELGIPKVDAKASLYLEVIASDIARGVVKNPTCCAFANATKRGIPGVHRVYFFRSCAWIEYDDRLIRYVLPLDCRQQIDKFDKTKTMQPGLYHLDSPKGGQTLKAIEKRGRKRLGRRHQPGNTKIKRKLVHAQPSMDVRSVDPKKWPTK